MSKYYFNTVLSYKHSGINIFLNICMKHDWIVIIWSGTNETWQLINQNVNLM